MRTKIEATVATLSSPGGGLPEGWSEASLAEILVTLESGARPRGGVRGITFGIPSVGGEHLNQFGSFRFDSIKFVPGSFYDQMRRGHISVGDILIVKDGATTGKVALVRDDFPYKFAVVNEHVFVCRLAPMLYPPFVFHYLFSKRGQKRLLENFRGSAQGGINQGFAAATRVPIAPVAEQKRIVAKIEALLTHVSSAREHLDRVPTMLDRFRQAVLAAACSGELTEDWRDGTADVASGHELLKRIEQTRAQRGAKAAGSLDHEEMEDTRTVALPESWVTCRIDQIATVNLGGTPSRKEPSYWNGDIPWVSSGEVANSRIKSTRERISGQGLDNSNAKVYPEGTVLIAMIGEGKTRGQAAILDISASTNQNVAGLVFDADNVLPDYVWYWALREYEQNRSVGRGGAQPALNGEKVRALRMPLPPLEEQAEISRRVGALFKLATAVEKRIAAARARTDQLTQAILVKAFHGELVPTEAELAELGGRDYESAATLLVRIHSIKSERSSKSSLQKRI